MAKRIHHMGMIVRKEAHDEFHNTAPDLSPKQHDSLMKRMGITKEQDEEWHRNHLTLGEQRARGLTQVDPVVIGRGFVDWSLKQRLLIQRGSQYFASKQALRELADRFEIAVGRKQER